MVIWSTVYIYKRNHPLFPIISRDCIAEECCCRYGYNVLNWLTDVSRNGKLLRHYAYDAFGNRTVKEEYCGQTAVRTAYRYNAGNQMVSRVDEEGEQSYSYDRRGNLTAVSRGEEQLRAFTFDAANRMRSAYEIKDGTGKRAEYTYNAFGNRIGQDVYGFEADKGIPEAAGQKPQNPERQITYILDLTRQYHNLLMSEDRAEQREQTFYWDGNVAAVTTNAAKAASTANAVAIKAANAVKATSASWEEGMDCYYLQDDLGSPMQLLDEEGEIRETYGFDEFGIDLYSFPEPQIQPFGYAGYQKEAAGGLYFAQARRYDAENGRFVSEDKIAGYSSAPFTLNRYTYCWNQPINNVDLNGLSREDARDYMEEYADEDDEKRNPDYPSFNNNCANFVSQCLVAGGVDIVDQEWFCAGPAELSFINDIPLINNIPSLINDILLKISSFENRMIGSNIYYNHTDPNYPVLLSDTWNSASAQYEYFSDISNGYINGDVIHVTTVEELEQVSGVQVGDLIYWDWYTDSDEIVNHATIVSKVDDDGTIYYAGNTNDHLEEKVSDVLSLGEIYIIRLNDCIFD